MYRTSNSTTFSITNIYESPKIILLGFNGSTFSFYVSRLLVVIDSSIFGLTLASTVSWHLGRTSSLIVLSVSQTLYYVGIIVGSCTNVFLRASSHKMELLNSNLGVLDGRSQCIIHGCDEYLP